MDYKKETAIADTEIAEYRTLCAGLVSLHEKFLKRKRELRRLLEETVERKRDALIALAKANRITRHLTGGQRQTAGISYYLGDIRARINQVDQSSPVLFKGALEEGESLPEIRPDFQPEFPGNSRLELKQKGLAILGSIDRIRKLLLQFDLLERRCRELIASIRKALEAFRHEFAIIRRNIYPFGIFSFFRRVLSRLIGYSYFSPGDMKEISALGRITGYVLKIADSPVI